MASGKKIALVIGHNQRQQGATNYIGETEYVFNSRMATKVKLLMWDMGRELHTIYRPDGSYTEQVKAVVRKASDLELDMTFHLHFNSSRALAKGAEILTFEDNGVCVADSISDGLNEEFGFKERADDGVRRLYEGHRGFMMLHELSKKGIMGFIVEPTFANYRHKESKIIFEAEDLYCGFLARRLYALGS